MWKMDLSQILDSSSSDDDDNEEEKESEDEEDEEEKKKKKHIKEEVREESKVTVDTWIYFNSRVFGSITASVHKISSTRSSIWDQLQCCGRSCGRVRESCCGFCSVGFGLTSSVLWAAVLVGFAGPLDLCGGSQC